MPIRLVKGDIACVQADIIVSAANAELAGGGGVDGAIHRAAGSSVMVELDLIRAQIGRCAPGRAVITNAGRLQAKHIVHAVGPIFQGGQSGEPQLLASCYRESLRLAVEYGAKSIAFPAISAGVYGYPVREAAVIALGAVREFLKVPGSIEEVLFVLFNDEVFRAFEAAMGTGCDW